MGTKKRRQKRGNWGEIGENFAWRVRRANALSEQRTTATPTATDQPSKQPPCSCIQTCAEVVVVGGAWQDACSGLLSPAAGAYWPLVTSPCPFLDPSPSAGGSAHWPLPALPLCGADTALPSLPVPLPVPLAVRCSTAPPPGGGWAEGLGDRLTPQTTHKYLPGDLRRGLQPLRAPTDVVDIGKGPNGQHDDEQRHCDSAGARESVRRPRGKSGFQLGGGGGGYSPLARPQTVPSGAASC